MKKVREPNLRKYRLLILSVLIQLCALIALGENSVVVKMDVDATEAARNILHTTIRVPVRFLSFIRNGFRGADADIAVIKR